MPISDYFSSHEGMIMPLPGSTDQTVIGMPGLIAAGCSAVVPTISTTPDPYFLKPRTRYVASSNGAGATMTLRHPAAIMTPGHFKFRCSFAIGDYSVYSTARMFLGLTSSVSALPNANPATFTNCVGVGHNAGDTVFSIYYGGTTAQTPISTGIPCNTAQRDVIQLTIESVDAWLTDGSIAWTLISDSNGETSGLLDTADPAVAPQFGTFLNSFNCFRSIGSGTGTVGIDLHGVYWKIG